jgi:hypothetical protein
MIARIKRLVPPAALLAALFVLGGAADAVANTIHPAPTCIEPSSCSIGVMTILVILVKVLSLV